MRNIETFQELDWTAYNSMRKGWIRTQLVAPTSYHELKMNYLAFRHLKRVKLS